MEDQPTAISEEIEKRGLSPFAGEERRRPIATRRLGVSRRTASWLARRGISANAISLAGMAIGIAAGVLLWLAGQTEGIAAAVCWLVAALCVQLRLLANMLDGMVAIETATASGVGELFNEIPDRISDSAILLGLGYATGDPVLGWAAALAAMATAYVRAVGVAAGAAPQFCGPLAKQQRMLVVTVAAIYAAIAAVAGLPGLAGEWSVPRFALAVIVLGCIVTAARRILRIARDLRRAPPP
jgi:phosphatidylglycerophosphate synthase